MHLGIKNKGYVVELKPLNEVYTVTYTVITKLKAEKIQKNHKSRYLVKTKLMNS